MCRRHWLCGWLFSASWATCPSRNITRPSETTLQSWLASRLRSAAISSAPRISKTHKFWAPNRYDYRGRWCWELAKRRQRRQHFSMACFFFWITPINRKPILKALRNSVPFATNWFLWRSNGRTNSETTCGASCRKKITRRNRTLRGSIHDPLPTWRNFILSSDTAFCVPSWGSIISLIQLDS